MKRYWIIALPIVLIIAVISFVRLLRPPDDVKINGAQLSGWLEESNFDQTKSPIQLAELEKNVPATVEYIIHFLEVERPRQELGIGHSLPTSAHKFLPKELLLTENVGREKQTLFALNRLSELGPQSEPAIPILEEYLSQSSKSLRDAASIALHNIGPASWGTVERILRDGSSDQKSAIVFSLTSRLSKPAPETSLKEKQRIIEIFLEACEDTNPEIQLTGVSGLMNSKAYYNHLFRESNMLDPAGPAVAKCLNLSDGLLKRNSARTIKFYLESLPLCRSTLDKMAASDEKFYSEPAKEALEAFSRGSTY